MWRFILNNKKLSISVLFLLAAFAYAAILNVKLANRNTEIEKYKSQKVQDSAQIIGLQREMEALKADTAKYRQGIRDFRDDLIKVQKIDKSLAKDLSSNFPSIDQIKRNPR